MYIQTLRHTFYKMGKRHEQLNNIQQILLVNGRKGHSNTIHIHNKTEQRQ